MIALQNEYALFPETLMTAATRKTKTDFQWDDPLLLDELLTDEERMVRDTAHALTAGTN